MSEPIDEITVQRINIVDADGKLRLAISNKSKFPAGSIDGRELQPPGGRGPGMLFFNEDGDECGGLIFAGDGESGAAGGALLFDRLKQDQTLGMMYVEESGKHSQGFYVWDRPDTALPEFVDKVREIEAISNEDERKRRFEDFYSKGPAGAPRLFAGRERDGSSCILLMDSMGRPRIRLAVEADDNPVIDVLGADGEVTWSLITH